jgi:hypothetical protein
MSNLWKMHKSMRLTRWQERAAAWGVAIGIFGGYTWFQKRSENREQKLGNKSTNRHMADYKEAQGNIAGQQPIVVVKKGDKVLDESQVAFAETEMADWNREVMYQQKIAGTLKDEQEREYREWSRKMEDARQRGPQSQ